VTAPAPAHLVRTGQRIHVAGRTHVVTRTTQRLIETRIGGSRHMACFELDDGTRYDAPLDLRVPVVAGGTR
jgi:hypothetical protein